MLTVPKNVHDVSPAKGFVASGVSAISGESVLDECTLFLTQPFHVLGEIRDGEKQKQGHDTSQGAFEDEDPSPATVASQTIHISNGSGEQAAKGSCQVGGTEEQTEPRLSFTPLIPHAQQVET